MQKAKIQRKNQKWIPAFAGTTFEIADFRLPI